METYAAKKRKAFDWNAFLDKATTKGVTASEQAKAERLAGDWVTCACGNQCSILERDGDGEPKDAQLNKLGLQFNSDISNEDFYAAKATLEGIEQRSAELLSVKEKSALEVLRALGYKIQ